MEQTKKPTIGTEHTVSTTVTEANTARAMGSGTLEVLATPAAAALMEQAACEMLQPYLDDGITTVGTMISLKHLSASPIGATVTAKATLTEIDGRRFGFTLTASDNAGLIAEGTHERFSVKSESFLRKAETKLGKA